MIVDEEEPVSAPGDIARDRTVSGFNLHLFAPAIRRDVFYRNAAIVVQRGGHITHRGFNQKLAGLNAAKPVQPGDKPERPVTAHVQKTAVVEEDDPGGGLR